MPPFTIKIGTDISSVKRIAAAYERFGKRFVERILTASEANYVLSNQANLAQRFAARFAAKEAVSKILGVGWHGIGFRDVEITKAASGAPSIKLHGRAAKLAERQGLTHFDVSLSHEKEFAIASILAYGNTAQ
jgi:holo-[acyl-carrier protein] synthase